MEKYEIEEMLREVEEATITTSGKAGTWQISVLKTILKALIFILTDMKNKFK